MGKPRFNVLQNKALRARCISNGPARQDFSPSLSIADVIPDSPK